LESSGQRLLEETLCIGKEHKLGDSLSNLSNAENADELTQFTGGEDHTSHQKSHVNGISLNKLSRYHKPDDFHPKDA